MTQEEIAKKLGVSQSSVSHVLRDPATNRVSKDVKEKIIGLLKSPAGSGRHYRRPTWNLGYLVDSLQNLNHSFYALALAGIEQQAADEYYNVIVESYRSKEIRMLSERRVDGVIVRSGLAWETLRKKDNELPIVLLNCSQPILNCDMVMPDNRGGMFKALEYLSQHGCRKPLFVGAQPDYSVYSCNYAERRDGFLEAARVYGMETSEICIAGAVSPESMEAIKRQLEALDHPFDAIVAVNHLYAVLAHSIFPNHSVIAGDNKKFPDYSDEGIAVLEMDVLAMGKIAAEMLLKRLHSPKRPFVRINCDMLLKEASK